MDHSEADRSTSSHASPWASEPQENYLPLVCRSKPIHWLTVLSFFAIAGFHIWASTLPNSAPSQRNSQLIICFGGASFFGLFGLWLTISMIRNEIQADHSGLRWRHAFTGWKQVRWEEIADYYYRPTFNRREIVKIVETPSGKLRLDSSFKDIDRIADVIARKALSARHRRWQDRNAPPARAPSTGEIQPLIWKEPLSARKYRFKRFPRFALHKLLVVGLMCLLPFVPLSFDSRQKLSVEDFLLLFLILYAFSMLLFLVVWIPNLLLNNFEATYSLDDKGLEAKRARLRRSTSWENIAHLEIVPHSTVENLFFIRIEKRMDGPGINPIPIPLGKEQNLFSMIFRRKSQVEIPFEAGQLDPAKVLELYQRHG
jgi:hypothetical protein